MLFFEEVLLYRAVPYPTAEHHGEDHLKDHYDGDHQGSQTNQVELLGEQLDEFCVAALRFQKVLRSLSRTQSAGDLFKERGVISLSTAVKRRVENIQHLDGGVFAGRPWDIHRLDVRRVVKIDQLFGDSIPVHEAPDCCSHFTCKQDHQKEEERSQQALRLLNGTKTSKETHQHHHGSNGYQDVHTDIEGVWCLVAFKLEYEEVAGLTIMA